MNVLGVLEWMEDIFFPAAGCEFFVTLKRQQMRFPTDLAMEAKRLQLLEGVLHDVHEQCVYFDGLSPIAAGRNVGDADVRTVRMAVQMTNIEACQEELLRRLGRQGRDVGKIWEVVRAYKKLLLPFRAARRAVVAVYTKRGAIREYIANRPATAGLVPASPMQRAGGGTLMADAHDLKSSDQDIGNCGERMVADSGGWGYYAHLSLYACAAAMVTGKRVLEAGCGTGYGSVYLSSYNPRSMTACDGSADAVEYCRRNYPDAAVTFEAVDLGEKLPYEDQSFDFIFSSNVMEHIGPIDSFLSECRQIIARNGSFFIAVPPNHSPAALEENIRNIFHITNLTPLGWHTKISRYFGKVRSFRHWPTGAYAPEPRVLADIPLPPEQTTIRETDFALEEMPIDALNTLPQNITAVFLASEPREQILPEDIREYVPQEWCAGAIISKVIQSEREIARAAQAEAAELRAAQAEAAELRAAQAARPKVGDELAHVLDALRSTKIHQTELLVRLEEQQRQIAKIFKVAKMAKKVLGPVNAVSRAARAVRDSVRHAAFGGNDNPRNPQNGSP